MNVKPYDLTGCSIDNDTLDYDSQKIRNNLSPEDIYNVYNYCGCCYCSRYGIIRSG